MNANGRIKGVENDDGDDDDDASSDRIDEHILQKPWTRTVSFGMPTSTRKAAIF